MVSAAAITTGAVTKVKMQASSDDGSVDANCDLEGSSVTIADTSDNTMTILEIVNPQKKWLKPVITRGTQNAAFESVFAVMTGAKVLLEMALDGDLQAAKLLLSVAFKDVPVVATVVPVDGGGRGLASRIVERIRVARLVEK